MHFTKSFLPLLASATLATALPKDNDIHHDDRYWNKHPGKHHGPGRPDHHRPNPWDSPAYFLLAGDSTTAPQTTGGGGWGNGFLNTTLRSPASGRNLGVNGRTTASFVSDGYWADLLALSQNHSETDSVYVTIQFGHNDQKPDRNVSLTDYATNLLSLATEAAATGAEPILLTPLTRRTFTNTEPPRIIESLANETRITREVAESNGIRWIDLNQASTDYCNAIGPEAAHAYNLAPDDNTHLNEWGSVVFGRMVSDLLVAKYGDIRFWTRPDRKLSWKIGKGVAA
ncbi:hypothetical protein MBLNU230_g8057t1 [Neophaeotheca triangularis]